MTGAIVGMHKENNITAYRVILYAKDNNGNWDCKKQLVSEEQLISALRSGKVTLDNAAIVDGKIKGTTGDLNRFNAKGFHPVVIVSEVVTSDTNEIIGYRVATYDGVLKGAKTKELLAYCNRVSDNGAPIQNAQYVTDSNNGKAYIRAYPGQEFRKEVVQRQRSARAQVAKVDTDANTKQVSKIEELFSKDQIKELKEGKKNGVDIRIYGNNKLSAEQMREIRKALESGINARAFADPSYSVEAMKALRINAKYGVDITYFMNPKYNAEQIFELSTGYLSGVDFTQYADPELSAKDMSKQRVYMESLLWNEVEAVETTI